MSLEINEATTDLQAELKAIKSANPERG